MSSVDVHEGRDCFKERVCRYHVCGSTTGWGPLFMTMGEYSGVPVHSDIDGFGKNDEQLFLVRTVLCDSGWKMHSCPEKNARRKRKLEHLTPRNTPLARIYFGEPLRRDYFAGRQNRCSNFVIIYYWSCESPYKTRVICLPSSVQKYPFVSKRHVCLIKCWNFEILPLDSESSTLKNIREVGILEF